MGAVRIAPMAKAFSVASWNIEHMKDADPRNVARMKFLADQKPDVLALYEVEGKEVWREVMTAFPKYSFFITEGQNTQEILVGIGPRVTGFLTQKVEFAGRQAYMRPGAFLTVRAAGTDYALLFLHVASDNDPRGFGLRADMIDRAFELQGGPRQRRRRPGQLHVPGRPQPDGHGLRARQGGRSHPARAGHGAARGLAAGVCGRGRDMRVLPKIAHGDLARATSMTSDLDWVVAADHLRFRGFAGGSEVDVRGWPALPQAEPGPVDEGLLRPRAALLRGPGAPVGLTRR